MPEVKIPLSNMAANNATIVIQGATSSFLHTAGTGLPAAGFYDEVFVWAANLNASGTLQIQLFPAGNPGGLIISTVNFGAFGTVGRQVNLLEGQLLYNSQQIAAFGGAGGQIAITGYAIRHTP